MNFSVFSGFMRLCSFGWVMMVGAGVLVASGCQSDGSNSSAERTLQQIDTFASSESCPEGGILVVNGADINDDGSLDSDEVTGTQEVCIGGVAADTPNAVALLTTEPISDGDVCPSGGVRIFIGYDDGVPAGIADNGVLDPGEVDETQVVCDGEDGEDGENGVDGTDGADGVDGVDGTDGADGMNGVDGVDGTDGFSALVALTEVPAGINCEAGGQRIDSGLDDGSGEGIAGNAVLESDEIDATSYVCNGIDSASATGEDGTSALTMLSDESVGVNCAAGGIRVDAGQDNGDGSGLADNGILETGEIDFTDYVCNGLNGVDGIDGEDGVDGIDGTDGIDGMDGVDGVDGENGYSSLLVVQVVGTETGCTVSGVQIFAGTDNGDGSGVAADGILQPGEVDYETTVCDGVDGQDGADGTDGIDGTDGVDGTDGISALISISSYSGGLCTNGGQQIDTGLDNGDGSGIARNNILESGEIDSTAYVCNGEDGTDGTSGGGISVIDGNGVNLGTSVLVDDYRVKVFTSTGHISQFDWAGAPDVTYTYFTGVNCTGTVFKYATSQFSSQDVHWGYIPSVGAGAVAVPFTFTAVDEGPKTPASRTKASDPGLCEAYTTVRDSTYTLTQTTYAAVGLPNTVAGPLTLQ